MLGRNTIQQAGGVNAGQLAVPEGSIMNRIVQNVVSFNDLLKTGLGEVSAKHHESLPQ